MHYSAISRVLGRYFFYFSGIFLFPLGVSLFYEFYLDEKRHLPISATAAFFATAALTFFFGLGLYYFGRDEKALHRKESILLVVLIWFLTAAIGSLPFLFTQVMSNPIDAYFESMSGLTTTGATIIHPKAFDSLSGQEIPITMQHPADAGKKYTFLGTVAPLKDSKTGIVLKEGIEALGKPLLFWRSFLEWLGGLGVVVLFIAILPALSVGGKFLFESEVSGPTKEGIAPRIKETASILLKIYLGLTLAQIILLMIIDGNLSLFDAVTLSFSTVSTGGFTTHHNCLAHYLPPRTMSVIALFMIFGSLNFSLYFYCLKRRFYRLNQPELFYYFVILIYGCLLVSLSLWKQSYSFGEALYRGSFQAISAQTSTGFSIENYDAWPFASQFLLLILMFVGGMSGSTAGGVKVIRYVIMFRAIFHRIESFFRPGVVHVLKVGDKEIPDKTAMIVFSFFSLMIFFVFLGTYLLTLDNIDPTTAFSVISTSINNNGLYFGGIGCTESLAFLSNFSKIISILWMVLGRLEFFSLLVLFLPTFWKN